MGGNVLYYPFDLYNLLILAEAFRQNDMVDDYFLPETQTASTRAAACIFHSKYNQSFLRFYILALYTCYHTGRFLLHFFFAISVDGWDRTRYQLHTRIHQLDRKGG